MIQIGIVQSPKNNFSVESLFVSMCLSQVRALYFGGHFEMTQKHTKPPHADCNSAINNK